MRHHALALLIVCPLTSVAAGCAGDDDAGLVEVRDAIFNGTAVSAAANPGTVAVYHSNVRTCSGTLVRPNWVLTAGHCTRTPGGVVLAPAQIRVAPPFTVQLPLVFDANHLIVPPSNAAQGAEVIRPAGAEDVALIRLAAPLARTSPASSAPGLQSVALWDGDTDQLTGQQFTAMGFGISSNVPGPSGNFGAGTLRSGVFTVGGVNELELGFQPNSAGQSTQLGDSGGPSYAAAAHYGPGPWVAGIHLASGIDESAVALRHQIKHAMACGAPVAGACKANIELVGGSGWTTWPEVASLGDGNFAQGFRALDNFLPDFFFTPAPLSATKRLGGDFNGDRNLDFALVVASPGSPIVRLAYSQGAPYKYALGGASFPFADEGASSFPGWAQASQPLVGDFNGDGRDDIALLAGPGWTSVPVAFSVGSGVSPTFWVTNRGVADFPALSSTAGVKMTVGDFNGDGRDDIALTGGATWGSIPIAFSGGDGTFTVNYIFAGPDFPGWARGTTVKALGGDYNGDGRDDIALVGGEGWLSIPVAFSAGDGTSTWLTNTPVSDFPVWAQAANARPVVADYDGDGRDDIALVGGAGTGWETVPVAFSLGDGQFRVTNGAASSFASKAQGANVRPFALRGRGPARPVHAATEITAARDGHGLLDVFYTSASGEIFHNHQLAANGGWSGEMPMGGLAKRIVAAANGDGRLELIAVGTDDGLWHNYQTFVGGGWSGWIPIGGVIRPHIAVTTDTFGRLSVFAFGTDEAVYNIAQVSAGSAQWASWWTTIGGAGARLAAAMNADGRLEEFHVGLDGALYHAWQQWADGPWTTAVPLGPAAARDVSAIRSAGGNLQVFYTKPNDELRTIVQSAQGWGSDAAVASSVRQHAVVLNYDGNLNVVVRNSSDRVSTATQPVTGIVFWSFSEMPAYSILANTNVGRVFTAVASTWAQPMEVIYANDTGSLTHSAPVSGVWPASRLIGDASALP